MIKASKGKIFLTFVAFILCSCATSTRETITRVPDPPPKWAETGSSSDCEPGTNDRNSYAYLFGVSIEFATKNEALENAMGDARKNFAAHISGTEITNEETQVKELTGRESEILNANVNSKEVSRQFTDSLVRGVTYPEIYTEERKTDKADGTSEYNYKVEVCAKISNEDVNAAREEHKKQIAKLKKQINSDIEIAQDMVNGQQFTAAILKLQTTISNEGYKSAELAELEDALNMKSYLLDSLLIEPVSDAEDLFVTNSISAPIEVRVYYANPVNGKKLPVQGLPILLTRVDGDESYESYSKTSDDGSTRLALPENMTRHPNKTMQFELVVDTKELQKNHTGQLSTKDINLLKSKTVYYRFNVQDPLGGFELNDFAFTLDIDAARMHYNKFSNTDSGSDNSALKKDVKFVLTNEKRSYIRIYAVTNDGDYVELLEKEQPSVLHLKGDHKKEEINFSIPYIKRHSSFFILASEKKHFLFDQLEDNARFTRHEFAALLKLFQQQEFETSVIHEKL